MVEDDISELKAAEKTQVPAGPQIQRREKWIELPKEYAGFKVKVWVNAPTKLWMALGAEDEAENQKIATRLVLAHNNWLDFDGNPYPPPSDITFWEEIPTELAGVVFAAIQAEMKELPNSVAPKRRRSKRG